MGGKRKKKGKSMGGRLLNRFFLNRVIQYMCVCGIFFFFPFPFSLSHFPSSCFFLWGEEGEGESEKGKKEMRAVRTAIIGRRLCAGGKGGGGRGGGIGKVGGKGEEIWMRCEWLEVLVSLDFFEGVVGGGCGMGN